MERNLAKLLVAAILLAGVSIGAEQIPQSHLPFVLTAFVLVALACFITACAVRVSIMRRFRDRQSPALAALTKRFVAACGGILSCVASACFVALVHAGLQPPSPQAIAIRWSIAVVFQLVAVHLLWRRTLTPFEKERKLAGIAWASVKKLLRPSQRFTVASCLVLYLIIFFLLSSSGTDFAGAIAVFSLLSAILLPAALIITSIATGGAWYLGSAQLTRFFGCATLALSGAYLMCWASLWSAGAAILIEETSPFGYFAWLFAIGLKLPGLLLVIVSFKWSQSADNQQVA